MTKLFWLCVLTICLNGFSSAADTDGTLQGLVTDSTGAVVPNVAVTVAHWDTSEIGHATLKEDSALKTDTYGRYSIHLKPGIYDICFSFPIFSPVAMKVKVEAGKTLNVDTKLKVDPLTETVEVQVR